MHLMCVAQLAAWLSVVVACSSQTRALKPSDTVISACVVLSKALPTQWCVGRCLDAVGCLLVCQSRVFVDRFSLSQGQRCVQQPEQVVAVCRGNSVSPSTTDWSVSSSPELCIIAGPFSGKPTLRLSLPAPVVLLYTHSKLTHKLPSRQIGSEVAAVQFTVPNLIRSKLLAHFGPSCSIAALLVAVLSLSSY